VTKCSCLRKDHDGLEGEEEGPWDAAGGGPPLVIGGVRLPQKFGSSMTQTIAGERSVALRVLRAAAPGLSNPAIGRLFAEADTLEELREAVEKAAAFETLRKLAELIMTKVRTVEVCSQLIDPYPGSLRERLNSQAKPRSFVSSPPTHSPVCPSSWNFLLEFPGCHGLIIEVSLPLPIYPAEVVLSGVSL
jgi:hypothetical protein